VRSNITLIQSPTEPRNRCSTFAVAAFRSSTTRSRCTRFFRCLRPGVRWKPTVSPPLWARRLETHRLQSLYPPRRRVVHTKMGPWHRGRPYRWRDTPPSQVFSVPPLVRPRKASRARSPYLLLHRQWRYGCSPNAQIPLRHLPRHRCWVCEADNPLLRCLAVANGMRKSSRSTMITPVSVSKGECRYWVTTVPYSLAIRTSC
jgi:hypothetical protein